MPSRNFASWHCSLFTRSFMRRAWPSWTISRLSLGHDADHHSFPDPVVLQERRSRRKLSLDLGQRSRLGPPDRARDTEALGAQLPNRPQEPLFAPERPLPHLSNPLGRPRLLPELFELDAVIEPVEILAEAPQARRDLATPVLPWRSRVDRLEDQVDQPARFRLLDVREDLLARPSRRPGRAGARPGSRRPRAGPS